KICEKNKDAYNKNTLMKKKSSNSHIKESIQEDKKKQNKTNNNSKKKNNINIDNHFDQHKNIQKKLTKQKKSLIEPQKLLAAIEKFKNHKKSLQLDNNINENDILRNENKNKMLSKQNYLCNVINSDDDTSENMFVYATK
ncbi:putative membrane protein, partial [Plasmodium gaboni]